MKKSALLLVGLLCLPALGFSQEVYGRDMMVHASSELAPGSRARYDDRHLTDESDLSWAEGAAGNGVGEYFELEFDSSPKTVAGFVLRNGYGNLDYYARNNRVKSFRVFFDGRNPETIAVKDSWEFEQYRFSKAVTCTKVRFVIQDVYPGSQYNDTCVAEVALLSEVISDQKAKSMFIDYRYEGTLDRPAHLGESLDIFEYWPFRNGSKAAVLQGTSSLKLTANLPRIDGATALYPVYAAFVQAVYPENPLLVDDADYYWRQYHPLSFDREIGQTGSIVVCGRTAKAYENLIAGNTDIIFCYEPSRAEIAQAAEKGLRFKRTPIGRDAFVFFVNRTNPINGLTLRQIRDIYSGKTRNWKSITGKDEPVIAYQRPEGSGSQTVLQSIMGSEPIINPMRELIAQEMGHAVDHVAEYYNYQSAMGYTFLYYVTRMHNNAGIKVLPINGITPSKETIQSRSYPFVKDIYAVTIEGRETENTRRFIQWILGEQGQYLVEKTGYVRN
ncbi:hypothetical protein FACS1894130_09420 [Spirochaetia bacterium]|nr:hypothetical protein FACS1894130_09420 [Spirochaetia bacterium]